MRPGAGLPPGFIPLRKLLEGPVPLSGALLLLVWVSMVEEVDIDGWQMKLVKESLRLWMIENRGMDVD